MADAAEVGTTDSEVDVIDPVDSAGNLVASGDSATVSVPTTLDGAIEVTPEGQFAGALTGISVRLPGSVEEGEVSIADDGSWWLRPPRTREVI